MARPLSEEKREAILAAATKLVAAVGTGAPTAQIAKEAGLAEGTLFKYFATKDELLNQLYLTLKSDLARIMRGALAEGLGPRERAWVIWDSVIDWGAADPAKRKALRQLTVSERVTAETRQAGTIAFQEASTAFADILAQGPMRNQPAAFVGAALESLADTTLEFIAKDPAGREAYKRAGFDLFWAGAGA